MSTRTISARNSHEATIRRLSKESYLEAMSKWGDCWGEQRTPNELGELTLSQLRSSEVILLAEEIANEDTLLQLGPRIIEQAKDLETSILLSSESGFQSDATKLTAYMAGVYIPVMTVFEHQEAATLMIERFVERSLFGFDGILGMKQQGMTDQQYESFDLDRATARRFRFLMLAPIFAAITANYDPQQPGREVLLRILARFNAEFVSPCTLTRMGLLALIIGWKNKLMIQRSITGAKHVGQEELANYLIAYASELESGLGVVPFEYRGTLIGTDLH
jgi:hypothetical protein